MKNIKSLPIVIIFLVSIMLVSVSGLIFVATQRAGSKNTQITEELLNIVGLNNDSVQNPDSSEGHSQSNSSQEKQFDVTGIYKIEETLNPDTPGTSTETEYTLIEFTVDSNNQLTGSFLQTNHFEAETIPDVGDSKKAYVFSGKVENYIFNYSVTYITTTDNNTVEPFHREYEQTSQITIEFTETKAIFAETVTGSNGVISTYTYELELQNI